MVLYLKSFWVFNTCVCIVKCKLKPIFRTWLSYYIDVFCLRPLNMSSEFIFCRRTKKDHDFRISEEKNCWVKSIQIVFKQSVNKKPKAKIKNPFKSYKNRKHFIFKHTRVWRPIRVLPQRGKFQWETKKWWQREKRTKRQIDRQ